LFGGCGLALAALALVVFGGIECSPQKNTYIFREHLFYRMKVLESVAT